MKRTGLCFITMFIALMMQPVGGEEGWQVHTSINVNVTVNQYK